MSDIGKQVRELLPEYPHLWSRVIAAMAKVREAALDEAEAVVESYASGFTALAREPGEGVALSNSLNFQHCQMRIRALKEPKK